MGFFPGAISFYNKKEKQVRDLSWAHSVIRLVRKAKAPVYPVYFGFQNTHFFYWLGISAGKYVPCVFLQRLSISVERKRMYIGEPISPEEIAAIPEDKDLAEFLYKRTYGAKNKKTTDDSVINNSS